MTCPACGTGEYPLNVECLTCETQRNRDDDECRELELLATEVMYGLTAVIARRVKDLKAAAEGARNAA
jgi:hypothetical protein